MRQTVRPPHVWAVEWCIAVSSPGAFPRVMGAWHTVYTGNEEGARKAFVEAEVGQHLSPIDYHKYREIKLWKGEELVLHTRWNR